MSRHLITLMAAIVAFPSVAWACSCADPDDLTERQMRHLLSKVSLIARGRVVAVDYPAGCSVAPLRWAYAIAGARLPVTYTIAVRETLLGRPVRTTTVVQRQGAGFAGCRPLGSAACEAALPTGDTLWVLNRMPNGEQRSNGGCGLALAPHFLRIARQGRRSTG